MTSEIKKVPVSKRALTQRNNRALEKRSQLLRRPSPQGQSTMGEFVIVDVGINGIVGEYKDLENLGRELGVLETWESLADDEG
jgi:hypothetical protein